MAQRDVEAPRAGEHRGAGGVTRTDVGTDTDDDGRAEGRHRRVPGDHDGDGVPDRLERDPGTGAGATRVRDAEPGHADTERARPSTVDQARASIAAARERQRERFGGFNWGAAFFGWLVAVGLAALLTGLLSAGGAAIGLTELSSGEANANAETIGLAGGIMLIAVLVVAYFCGGYVAGRMSRFDGARQGLGVWIFGLIVTIALAAVAVIAGSEYNVLERVGLPRLPVGEETLGTAGLVATALILIGTALAALIGGKTGERYHKKVDREGFGKW